MKSLTIKYYLLISEKKVAVSSYETATFLFTLFKKLKLITFKQV